MEATNTKLRNIEFLRFILIIGVTFCHVFGWLNLFTGFRNNLALDPSAVKWYGRIYDIVATGRLALCVEFFFIISGFFFYRNMQHYRATAFPDTATFIYKKLIRLYPVFFCFYIIYAILPVLNHWGGGRNIPIS